MLRKRLGDAQALLVNSRYGAAYYLVGYAVECSLKACIAKLMGGEDFYDKSLAGKIFTHKLENLANYARLDMKQISNMDSVFAANWAQAQELGRRKSI